MPTSIPRTALSSSPPPTYPPKIYPPFAHAIAGAGGGLATVLLLHPLDTLRTRLQSVQSKSSTGQAMKVFRGMVLREGAGSLYKGVVPAGIGSVLSWGCYFQVFHSVIGGVEAAVGSGVGAHLLTGTFAGSVTSVVTNPVWVVKVRLQLQGKGDGGYKGFMDGLMRIAKEEGVRGLYKGLGPSLLLVSHGAVQFTMYEGLKKRLSVGKEGVGIMDSLIASTASKLVASVATYPMQVARTRMQERWADGVKYGRFDLAFMYIFRTEGIRGLYRGLSANIIRVTPQAAVTFVTYEQILKLTAR